MLGEGPLKEVDKWRKRFKYRKVSRFAITICLLLSFTVIGLTIYGSNVGNFVVTVEKAVTVSMALADNAQFNNSSSLLTAEGLREMTHATYRHIPADIGSKDGSDNDNVNYRYMAYTFYAKNLTEIAVNYDVEIVITKVYKNVDAAIRVMVIKNGEKKIFAKPQETGENIGQPEQNINDKGISEYVVENFSSPASVYKGSVKAFSSGQVDKYTVVIWIEGWDPQCSDSIKGGTIKMEMKFWAY